MSGIFPDRSQQMKTTIMNSRKAKICIRLGLLFSGLVLAPRGAEGATYGWTDVDGQSSDATRIGYYSTAQLDLFDGDTVKGYATLAGGFVVDANATVTLSHIVPPVGGTITLLENSTLAISGDLHLDSMAQLSMSGSVYVDSGGGALVLHGDLALPNQIINLVNHDWTVDGQSHTLTFNGATMFDLGGQTLTLRNMTIRGLTGGSQFLGLGTLVLDNCKIDLGPGTTFTYDNANLTINRDVDVRGGGTFRFDGMGTMTLNSFSTLRVDPGTTFDYNCFSRNLFVMSDATSTLELDSCTLKAQGMEGLQLTTGRVVVEGEVTADNGANTSPSNGIQLGDGATAANMLFKPGSRFNVLGKLWYNKP